jgi:predicted RND superfamily exporter protein
MVIPSAVFLLLRIVFTILVFLLFQLDLRIALFMSLNNCVGILMGIALKYSVHICYVHLMYNFVSFIISLFSFCLFR